MQIKNASFEDNFASLILNDGNEVSVFFLLYMNFVGLYLGSYLLALANITDIC